MDERTQFVGRLLTGQDEMAALCREYWISRKTGYKWLGRYRREGAAGLRERSPAPLRHGRALDVSVVQAVLGLRERSRRWGAGKLRAKLAELHPELAVPAASMIGDWLCREGLVRFADVDLGYIDVARRLGRAPLRTASRPVDLLDSAGALPTTPQAPQPQPAG